MFGYERAVCEVNLDNIGHNIREIKKKVGNTKVLAVVKADGYGHGAVEVSKKAVQNGADWLGVAITDEGIRLREAQIDVPILILGYTPDNEIEDVIKNNLTQTIFSYEKALTFSKAALKLNKTAEVHIKIDTGMERIGFMPNQEGINEIMKISQLNNIKITGVFTHFADSDSADKTFAWEQFNKFLYMTNELEKRGIKDIIRHGANSGAILDIPEFYLDMVRAGIILYGLMPSNEVKKSIDIIPAMSLKTYVSFVKKVKKGTSIGYGRTFYTDKDTVVATIPVGYADGYFRLLSNKSKVLINGKYLPVIGNICMDQFMVDASEAADVKAEDEVVLFGEQNGLEITVDELAGLINTINYEIVCNVGRRIPRIYIENGIVKKVVKLI